MIKKSKNYPQEIAEKIQSALEYNKENPQSPNKTLEIEISKGLYNCGSIAIRNNVCNELGIKPWDAPFTTKIKDNDDYHFLLITFK